MDFFLYLALVITIVLAIFAYQNTALVTLSFYTWEFSDSLAFVVATAFGIGILTGLFLTLPGRVRRARQRRELQKKLKEAETMAHGRPAARHDVPDDLD